LAMTMVSNQLMDKQEKHQRFLQFLALSKCHEELCTKQSMIYCIFQLLLHTNSRMHACTLIFYF
jgi:hypothetical protein